MSEKRVPGEKHDKPEVYEIRLKGHLHRQWEDWFDGLTITLEENGETRVTGPVADQSALHGLLRKVRDLGMPLLSVHRLEAGHTKRIPFDEDHTNRSKKEK